MSGFVSLVGAGPGDEELKSLSKEHGDLKKRMFSSMTA